MGDSIPSTDIGQKVGRGAKKSRVARRGRLFDGASAVADQGLSIGHISPQEFWAAVPSRVQWRNSSGSLVSGEGQSGAVEWYPDGSLLKVQKPSVYCVKSSLRRVVPRGSVSGFSRRSRTRLLQMLGRTQRAELPLFVTLTYPGQWSNDPTRWKRDLDVFAKRFRREFPTAGFVWKLEAQQRGAPHFHLLAWGGMTRDLFYARLMAWLSSAWYEVVASGDEKHLRAGTRVERIESWRGVMHYTSKYMGKPVCVGDDAWGRPGRFWGIVGKDNIPWAERLATWLYYSQACDLMRWLRRFRRLRGRDYPSLWAVVESPDTWITNFERYIT